MSISMIKENFWEDIIKIQKEAYTEIPPEDVSILKSKWLSSPKTCAVYLNRENMVLAYLLAHPWASEAPPKLNEKSPTSVSLNLYLHDLALADSARGKGIAKKLIENLVYNAKVQGFEKILLVAVQNSIGFWGKLGFLNVPNVAICSSYGDNAQLMALELKT